MERYFILMIVVTLVAVATQKKNGEEANFRSTLLKERKGTAPITTCENSADYTEIRTSYIKFKTSSDVVTEENIYGMFVNKTSIQKIIKSRRGRVTKMSSSTNPRVLFNILRSLPMGEPFFIQ